MEKCRITERVVSFLCGCFRYRISDKVTPLSERKRYETNNAVKVGKRQYFRDNPEMSKGNARKRWGNIAQRRKKNETSKINSANELVEPINNFFHNYRPWPGKGDTQNKFQTVVLSSSRFPSPKRQNDLKFVEWNICKRKENVSYRKRLVVFFGLHYQLLFLK